MKLLIAFFGLLAIAAGQSYSYTASQDTTLAAAAEVVTIQMPASSTTVAQFYTASITCVVACDLTVERDGTAAATTAITPKAINPFAPGSSAAAFRSSNVGVGTVLAIYAIPAGGTLVLDMTAKTITRGQNLTFRTSSVTGRVVINVQWTEQ